MAAKMRLTYWPIAAKNLAPSIALELADMDWEYAPGPGSKGTGNLWGEWLEMKQGTIWGFLPNLEIPGAMTIGSELAILQFIARKAGVTLAGSDDSEFGISQELLHQAEELYQKMCQKIPTIMAQDKSPEEYQKFMDGNDRNCHSNAQGLQVYLSQLEDFYAKTGGSAGKFTTSGTTIGEIKLFATLLLLVMIKADVLASYPNLSTFMATMGGNDKVAAVVAGNLPARNLTEPPTQYFISPP